MHFKAFAASILILSLYLPFKSDCASAQSFNNRHKKQGEGQARREKEDEQDLAAPIQMQKFPGVGSIDSWKTSVPEFREGMTKMRNKRWDEAIAHFRASIALYEYQPEAWVHLGHCIEKKGGLLSDAETAYRHAVKLDAQNWQSWKGLGNVLYMQKKFDEARQSVSNAMNLSPPPKQRQDLGKMIQMIDAGMANGNTQQMNTGSD